MPCRRPRPAPPEPGQAAEVPLYVTAWQDYLTVYRDMSGESLHRRGYRSAMHRASLNESAAAGCLLLAGWPEAALSGAPSSRLVSAACSWRCAVWMSVPASALHALTHKKRSLLSTSAAAGCILHAGWPKSCNEASPLESPQCCWFALGEHANIPLALKGLQHHCGA